MRTWPIFTMTRMDSNSGWLFLSPAPCFVLFEAYDCLRQNDTDINIFCCSWYLCQWSVLVSSQYYILMYQRHCLHLSISMSQISWSEYKLLHSHHLPQTLDKIRKIQSEIIWKSSNFVKLVHLPVKLEHKPAKFLTKKGIR